MMIMMMVRESVCVCVWARTRARAREREREREREKVKNVIYVRKIWCKRRYYGRVRGVILRSGKVSGELNRQTERVVWKEWVL